MSNTVSNVTAAKPKTAGAIFVAPIGTTLPTDSSTTLDSSFKNLGYVSEDGVKNNNSASNEQKKAWGGDTVLDTQTDKPDTFSFTLIEALNAEVMKYIYGSVNVSGSLAAGIAISANATEAAECSLVIEMILRNNVAKRIVIPRSKLTEVGEISYADSDAVGYECTVSAYADSLGNTHYEYIKSASITPPGDGDGDDDGD